MQILVGGIMYTPMGGLAEGITVRLTATKNSDYMLKGMASEYVTLSGGVYEFNVVYGTYEVEIFFSDEFILTGEVVVDESIVTTVSLPMLMSL